jgi:c-di-GMP-binding flagellar brake protein YcgR
MTIPAEKRRSPRIVPIGSNEDVVVMQINGEQYLAKILDLSDGGTCVYAIEPDVPLDVGDTFRVAFYHKGHVEEIDVTVSRKNGQVAGLEFDSASAEAKSHIQAKIIRLEVEWMRLKPTG